MRVNPIRQSAEFQTPPVERISYSQAPNFRSSIENIQANPRNFIVRAYHYVREKVMALFAWIRSFFVQEKKVYYFKVPTENVANGTVFKGKDNDIQIRLAPKYAFLSPGSSIDENDRDELPPMLMQIMEDEKIDGIHVNNFRLAYLLWKSGLETKDLINIKLKGKDPLNEFLCGLIQTAMLNKDQISVTAQTALLRLEGQMIRSIIAEQDAYEWSVQAENLVQIIDRDQCRGRIDDLEATFMNCSFDLPALIKKAEKEDDPDYAQTLQMIPQEKGDNPIDGENVFELFLEDLFILIDATKTPVKKAIIGHLPNLTFTKRT